MWTRGKVESNTTGSCLEHLVAHFYAITSEKMLRLGLGFVNDANIDRTLNDPVTIIFINQSKVNFWKTQTHNRLKGTPSVMGRYNNQFEDILI